MTGDGIQTQAMEKGAMMRNDFMAHIKNFTANR